MNYYKKHNTYGKLKNVLLGSYFYPEFFSKLKNDKIKTPLQRIAEEILEDLDNFDSVLKSFGCNVLKAPHPTGYFDLEDVFPPSLQIRNNHCVIGDTLYQFDEDYRFSSNSVLTAFCPNIIDLSSENIDIYHQVCKNSADSYNSNTKTWFSLSKYQELQGADWPQFKDYVQGNYQCSNHIQAEIDSYYESIAYEIKEFRPLQSPNVLNLDDKIYIDAHEYYDYASWLRAYCNDSRPIEQFTSKVGHVDGCFNILNKNTIIGIHPFIDYDRYFPEFDIIKVDPDSYQSKIHEFKLLQERIGGRWWVPGEEYNLQFVDFVENYLEPWLGRVHETIFDVNVLVLDEKTVCVSNITKQVAAEFKKRRIEYIVVPWRHRFFVDGGLHCITLDLTRE